MRFRVIFSDDVPQTAHDAVTDKRRLNDDTSYENIVVNARITKNVHLKDDLRQSAKENLQHLTTNAIVEISSREFNLWQESNGDGDFGVYLTKKLKTTKFRLIVFGAQAAI